MALLRCISSLGCPERALPELLALANEFRLDGVELRTLGGTVDLAAHLRAHFGTPAGLASALASSGVRVMALDASLKLMAPADADRVQLAELAAWADGAGVPRLRVFDGGAQADAGDFHLARETWAWWAALRRDRGWQVELMVETHDSLFTADRIRRFVAAVPDAAILWDAHHTWRKGGEDPVATWRAIREQVVHVHIKDSVPVPSARHPYTYVLPGDGGFPVGPVLDALRQDAFAGPVSLEWERMWHPYLPPLEEALKTAAARRWW